MSSRPRRPRRASPRSASRGSSLPGASRCSRRPRSPGCWTLLALLPGMVEIETNGTVAPPPALDALVDQYNVSPKLAHSGNPAELALLPERLTPGPPTRAPSSSS